MVIDDFANDPSFYLEFVAESLEHLDGIDRKLLEYERNPADGELINGIFRAIHTIKGGSGFLNLGEIQSLSHRMETLLDQLRKGDRQPNSEIMEVLFAGCDLLKALVEEINHNLDAHIEARITLEDDRVKKALSELDTLISSKRGKPGSSASDSAAFTPLTLTPRLLEEFQVEASEHVETCCAALVRIDQAGDDREALNDLFRGVHSIKGTSSYLGFKSISDLAHVVEELLELTRRKDNLRVEESLLDVLFESFDLLREMIQSPRQEAVDGRVARMLTSLAVECERLNKEEAGAAPAAVRSNRRVDPIAIFLDSATQHLETFKSCLAAAAANPAAGLDVDVFFRAAHSLKSSARYMGFEDVEKQAVIIEETLSGIRDGEFAMAPIVINLLRDSIDAIEVQLTTKVAQTEQSSDPRSLATMADDGEAISDASEAVESPSGGSAPVAIASTIKTMRIDQRLLDSLMNLVGELIVARNAFSHIERRLEENGSQRVQALREMRSATNSIVRISEEMQRNVMEMRMVPVRNVFQKFPRIVRDITRKNGKSAELILQGEETEIDKGIAEDIGDPLVHIIRNAVDHGIESPEERRAAGKSPEGTIILRALHEGNFIVIDIIDDGRGIDPEAILNKAVEKGLTTPAEAALMTQEQIFSYIFMPGFSTAREVTDISGRGVGMDVVMTNLRKLKGSVKVTSEVGKGTHVRLEVPLTLAMVDALLVGVNHDIYAIPLGAVAETVKVAGNALKPIMEKRAITLRGDVIGVERLGRLLGAQCGRLDESEELTILILQAGNQRMGVVVDRIHRKEEIVVKPLADYLSGLAGLAGASILGDGRAILILEPADLFALANERWVA